VIRVWLFGKVEPGVLSAVPTTMLAWCIGSMLSGWLRTDRGGIFAAFCCTQGTRHSKNTATSSTTPAPDHVSPRLDSAHCWGTHYPH
jgi:hypothetical protein